MLFEIRSLRAAGISTELELAFHVSDLSSCREAELIDPKHLVVYARKLDVINRGLSGFNTDGRFQYSSKLVGWILS